MDRKDRKSDKLIRSVIDEKTRYNELKKLVLSSPDCFKVFRYLSLQMDDKSIKDIEEGTKLDVVGDVIRKFHKIVDYNEIKAVTSKMDYFPVIGKRYYYLVKNKIVDALREEISLISPDKYLGRIFCKSRRTTTKKHRGNARRVGKIAGGI